MVYTYYINVNRLRLLQPFQRLVVEIKDAQRPCVITWVGVDVLVLHFALAKPKQVTVTLPVPRFISLAVPEVPLGSKRVDPDVCQIVLGRKRYKNTAFLPACPAEKTKREEKSAGLGRTARWMPRSPSPDTQKCSRETCTEDCRLYTVP